MWKKKVNRGKRNDSIPFIRSFSFTTAKWMECHTWKSWWKKLDHLDLFHLFTTIRLSIRHVRHVRILLLNSANGWWPSFLFSQRRGQTMDWNLRSSWKEHDTNGALHLPSNGRLAIWHVSAKINLAVTRVTQDEPLLGIRPLETINR